MSEQNEARISAPVTAGPADLVSGTVQRPPERLAYLGLGSNVGARDDLLRAAIRALQSALRVVAVSSVWDTAPLLVEDQPRFHNAAIAGFTSLEPYALLAEVKRIERELGRAPGPRYGPRPIDIDILLLGDVHMRTPELTIPHPELTNRAFALAPLAEIAPHVGGRTLGREACDLAADLLRTPGTDVRRIGPLAQAAGDER